MLWMTFLLEALVVVLPFELVVVLPCELVVVLPCELVAALPFELVMVLSCELVRAPAVRQGQILPKVVVERRVASARLL